MATLSNIVPNERLIYGEGTFIDEWQAWGGLDSIPICDIEQAFPLHKRVLIIAPHPDDEILGCGGLIQKLARLNRQMAIIAVTNGTQSHPQSSLYTSEQLNKIRPQETLDALKMLHLDNKIDYISLDLMDGQISNSADKLYTSLENLIHTNDILITTFEKDGHPDHEASGTVVSQLAANYQLTCYRVLIWTWHWAKPAEPAVPWKNTFKIELAPAELKLKREALACFKSQCEADPSTSQPPILSALTIERLLQPLEVFVHE